LRDFDPADVSSGSHQHGSDCADPGEAPMKRAPPANGAAKTPRGGDTWNQVTVMRVMRRLGLAGK
jgi:hypothetical protein